MTRDNKNKNLTKQHRYQTRRATRLNLPLAKHRTYQNSFLVRGLSDYDKLPTDLKTEKSIDRFVKEAKKSLSSKY